MTASKFVKVLHHEEGAYIFEAIVRAFEDYPDVLVDNAPDPLPEAHEIAVAVFVLTRSADTDENLVQAVSRLDELGLPILPVVEDVIDDKFGKLPDSLSPVKKYNAVSWNESPIEGDEAIQAIKRFLGFKPLMRHRRVFISYRRQDGEDVAVQVYNHLSKNGYSVFLDTKDIEAGEDVQDIIYEEIKEKDFLLLIDSPLAALSDWVQKEITLALKRRVTVCGLRLPESRGFPLIRGMPFMLWDRNDGGRLEKLERFISLSIASKETFDQRVNRTLNLAAWLFDCTIQPLESRQVLFSCAKRGYTRTFFLEYEDAPISLLRLYRLYQNFGRVQPKVEAALFIHSGLPLSPYEIDAVSWAKGNTPLETPAVSEIINTLQNELR